MKVIDKESGAEVAAGAPVKVAATGEEMTLVAIRADGALMVRDAQRTHILKPEVVGLELKE